jgi:predicted RNase H-like HicB family nuclease
MATIVYPALFSPDPSGGFVVTFPDFVSCNTQGENEADALLMAKDVLALYVDTLCANGLPVPPPSPLHALKPAPGCYVTLVDADPERYAAERRNRAIRRTVSIPQWMDERAAQDHVSLSKVLQAALAEQFAK